MRGKFNLRVLAEISIFAALGFALDTLQGGYSRALFPSGGSIGLAMLPVLIISYRRGLLPGILCGLILSIIQMSTGPYVINASSFESHFLQTAGPFIQIMLDYVLGYTVVGFAGAFAGLYGKNKKVGFLIAGCVLGGLLKYVLQVVSGGVFWMGDGSATFMGVNNATWLYSFVYNGAYNIPNIILCTVFMIIIAKKFPQALDTEYQKKVEEISDEER